jgi:hypothetical protein
MKNLAVLDLRQKTNKSESQKPECAYSLGINAEGNGCLHKSRNPEFDKSQL